MSTATTADALDVRNPADGRLVATVPPIDTRETVNSIAADLRRAQLGWAQASPRQRSRWLHRWRDWILAHTDELTDLLQAETGKVRPPDAWLRRQHRASSSPTTQTMPRSFSLTSKSDPQVC